MIVCQIKMHLQSVGLWMCSYGFYFACRCEALDWLVYIFDVLLVVPEMCIPWVVSIILRMFDLSTLGLGRSEGASRRPHIHLIWHIWQFRGGVFVSLLCQTGFFALMQKIMARWLFYVIVSPPPNNLSMMTECVINIHHLYQLPDWLDAVYLAMPLVA